MRKSHNTEFGFSTIEGVLLLVIVVIISVVGFTVYKNRTQPTTTTNPAVSAKPTASTQNIITMKELGIQFTVPDNLKSLIYTVKNTDYSSLGNNLGTSPTAYISTKEIAALVPGECSIDSPSSAAGTVPPLGFIIKTQGQYPQDPTADNTTGTLVKQFPTYYIALRNAGMTCFSDPKNGEKIGPLFYELQNALKSAQEIK